MDARVIGFISFTMFFGAAPAYAGGDVGPLGCEYNVLPTGTAPAIATCNGNQEDIAPFAAIEPNTGHRIVTGIRAPRTNDLLGPFEICVPLPVGVTVDSFELVQSNLATPLVPTSSGLQGTADGQVQDNYCAAYGTNRDILPQGQDMLLGLSLIHI